MVFFVVPAASFPALELGCTFDLPTLELNAVLSFESLGIGFPILVKSKFELFALSVPRL